MLDTPAPIATLEPRLLADQIERTANEVFDDNKLGILLGTPGWKTKVTRLIKQTIGDLGQELGYHVAAPGFPHFDRGWVYDVVWFVPGHGRFEVVMAMESELDPIAITFDDDFLKLLDSTADVRVAYLREKFAVSRTAFNQLSKGSGALQEDDPRHDVHFHCLRLGKPPDHYQTAHDRTTVCRTSQQTLLTTPQHA